jgi:hypothetical protein
MIHFTFRIRNPWSDTFKNLWCHSYATPIQNKFIELEIYKDSSIVSFNFDLTVRQSHAGLDTEIGIFGYCFHFNFYDNRHWNYEENRYFKYSEEKGMY